MDIEKLTMKLVVNSGTAKSKLIEAMQAAREKDYKKARNLHNDAAIALSEAHEIQTDIIQEESDGKLGNPSMLMMHAQDHLMNALLLKELAYEIIELYKRTGDNK